MKPIVSFLLFIFVGISYSISVTSVTVEGNTYVSDSLITRALGIETGQLFVSSSLPQGVRSLFGLGYFTDIQVFVDSASGQANFRILVSENPILAGLKIENSGCLNDDELVDTLALFPGQTVSINDIDRSLELIKDLYAEDNRHLAEVSYRWEIADSSGRSTLIFECNEGPDVRVGEIEFIDNFAFSDDQLRGKMKTKQDSFWRSGKLKPVEFEQSLISVADYYHNHGYPDAVVLGTDRYLMADNENHFHIDIFISEGEYKEFGNVSILGNTELSDSLMQRMSTIKYGKAYSVEDLNKTLENFYSAYQDRGYFYASISPMVGSATESDSILDISFTVEEGERAHVRKIQIIGNTRTYDNVIRRQLTIVPGDLFRRSNLMRSIRNVYFLNYFADVVPDFRSIEGSPDVDMIIDVVEKPTGKFGIGANYSANDGFSGYLEVAETNFFGHGQNVGATWEFSKTLQNIKLSFTEPWFRDTPLTLGGEIYHTTSNYTEYDRRRTGASILVGRPLPWIDFTSASIRYTLEKVDVFDITTDPDNYYYSLNDTEWPRWDSSVRLSFTRDSQDRRVFPGEGSKNTVSLDLTGGFLGGDIGFQKYLFDSTWHVPVWWKFFLTLRGRMGTIAGFGGEVPPAYELFQLGGTGFYGIRGYGSREINAIDGYETVGGKAMVILSTEFRFRIIDQLQLAVFTDAGNTWESWSDMDLSSLNRGAGLGIRVEIPMLGIMGLDYAYGFDGPQPGWEPHFQMGTTF